MRQKCENHQFFARISVLNQDRFASLEGTKGSFLITVCCNEDKNLGSYEKVQNLVWLSIYLSAKI